MKIETNNTKLLNLINNSNLIIVKPIKETVVLMHKNEYINIAWSFLNLSDFKILTKNLLSNLCTEFKCFLKKCQDTLTVQQTHYLNFIVKNPSVLILYSFPKIHKPNMPISLIVFIIKFLNF